MRVCMMGLCTIGLFMTGLAGGCRERLAFDDAGSDAGADVPDAPTISDSPVDGGSDAGAPCNGPPGLYVPGSCNELAPGVRRFAPLYPLWSDGAEKERFVLLPEGSRIDTTDPNAWIFPLGTTFFKTFSRDGLRIETRINTKVSAGVGMDSWTLRTFAWSADQTSVTEVTEGVVNALGTEHDIPAVSLCASCHASLDVGLGFSAMQLNHEGSPTNLGSLFTDGLLTAEVDLGAALMPGPADTAAALGYMHANCGSCHGGPSPQPVTDPLVLWVDVGIRDPAFTGTYMTTVSHPSGWAGAALRVSPGLPDDSAILRRMETRVLGEQMPPVATELVHTAGIAAVRRWILSL